MNIFKSEKAATEVVDNVLVLAITILGISLIVLFAIPAIMGLQDLANMKNMEQAQTVFDSRASKVALGESPQQITKINLGGGTLSVIPNSSGANNESYMVVRSLNNTFNIKVPMGKVQYELNDRIVGYEGGGIWSRSGTNSVMLSPPEVHYDGVTLTLPIFNISGNDSVSGKGNSEILWNKKSTTILYPNTLPNRTNPVNFTRDGKVYVYITSDFYKAWADFFTSSMKYSRVINVNDSTRTASIELRVVPSTLGAETSLPPVAIDIRGLDPDEDEPMINYTMRLYYEQNNPIDWDLRAMSGTKSLIYWIDQDKLKVGYYDSSIGKSETWGEPNKVITPAPPPNNRKFIDLDLLDNNTYLTYDNITAGNTIGSSNGVGVNCDDADKIRRNDLSIPDFSWDDIYINTTVNNTQSLRNITQHYISEMANANDGDLSFSLCAPGSSKTADGSTLLLDHKSTGSLTYLYITDNQAQATIS